MNHKISVVIRNKNQSGPLEFLLKNLVERYSDDIDEIIVLDNLSKDNSKEIIKRYGAKLVVIEQFTYGGSANLAAESCSNSIIVIFSAHAYPVSHDFFKQIIQRFKENDNLAGVRCLHNPNDYKNFIRGISSKEDPNKSGLIFCGSAFNKEVWRLHEFKEDIRTFEDKEWTRRILKNGYDIEFSPSIFSYEIKRTRSENFFRFKNEVVGAYQLWHQDLSLKQALKAFAGSLVVSFKNFLLDVFFIFKRLFFMINFLQNKPDKF